MIALEHPYPTQLIDRYLLPDGRRVTLRPVLPQDAELERTMVRDLSREARYHRFFNPIHELSPQWLALLTQIDYQHHVALVAETFEEGIAHIVGEARYVVDEAGQKAEFAVVVADGWRGQGIATRLLDSLAEHARAAGLQRLVGEVLATNEAMLAMMRKLGFKLRRHAGDARLVQVSRGLEGADY